MNKDGANSKESVRIRFKSLADGSQSIYLDCYYNGKREYRFLNIYLKPEKGRGNKAWNKQQLALAEAIKAQTIVDMQNGKFGFRDTWKTRARVTPRAEEALTPDNFYN